jgi:hypothetical protein
LSLHPRFVTSAPSMRPGDPAPIYSSIHALVAELVDALP